MNNFQNHRSEQEVFEELGQVCTGPGFAHAVAFFCFRDNTIPMGDELTTEDVLASYTPDRLIRTEINTLIGLMLKEPLNLQLKDPQTIQNQLERADALLKELHSCLNAPLFNSLKTLSEASERGSEDPFANAAALREPIFYGGESAYDFQYRDLAPIKYKNDEEWLKRNKGFTIEEATSVFRAIADLQSEKLLNRLNSIRSEQPEKWSMLPAYSYDIAEICRSCQHDTKTVAAVLDAFAFPSETRNATFKSLSDFNAANAYPVIKHDNLYYVFQTYTLFEALYETPFFWMLKDKDYKAIAVKNRGLFTETFCYDRLKDVFGSNNVFQNVILRSSKGKDITDIDVLVRFAHIGIIVQAKSKRLSIEARKGNDGILRDDFKKGIQAAYNQGMICAQEIMYGKCHFYDQNNQKIEIADTFDKIFLIGVLCDHYPALTFQCNKLLEYSSSDAIPAPFITDIFNLELATEFLNTPLYFIDYINKRTKYYEKISISHEFTALSYHLKHNLWLEDGFDHIYLADDITSDLDVAVFSRRLGIGGARTPDGILTKFADKTIGKLIKSIETLKNRAPINLGLLLLSLNEECLSDINTAIEQLASLSRKDGRVHDATFWFENPSLGLTVHINDDEINDAAARLNAHCEMRKYLQKASGWYGLCLSSHDYAVRMGVELNYPWTLDPEVEERYKNVPKAAPGRSLREAMKAKHKKIGRNAPCICGSGLKYKKCCLPKR
ncbi:hypothetical protein GGR34_003640 [Microvirga flocculans]|uniref:Prepilin peptidase n=1 Tax=Microvirga flocculans TaxID=217168 RepID=A0A7W6N9R7_9HYPH|nr:SEC-C domain-containing protein [Microvirga flocculans]MBB4041956.1 hypothetical protein [Microvirga flocculans]